MISLISDFQMLQRHKVSLVISLAPKIQSFRISFGTKNLLSRNLAFFSEFSVLKILETLRWLSLHFYPLESDAWDFLEHQHWCGCVVTCSVQLKQPNSFIHWKRMQTQRSRNLHPLQVPLWKSICEYIITTRPNSNFYNNLRRAKRKKQGSGTP